MKPNTIIDRFVAPFLVPSVMFSNVYKMHKSSKPDLLYYTVAIGTIISSLAGPLYSKINQRTASRKSLVLFKAVMLTVEAVISIVLFHLTRLNLSDISYVLPNAVRGLQPSNGSQVFRYHFFVDIIPGLLVFAQVQLSSAIRQELVDRAKRKTTYGEASILSQLASAAFGTWALAIYSKLTGAGLFMVDVRTSIVLNVGLALFFIALLPAYFFIKGRSTVLRHGLLAMSLILSYSSVKTLVSNTSLEPFTWLIDHIFATHQRISLFSLWLSTLTACISFSTSWSRMVGHTNSLVRKVFHLAICVVFISGYNQDIEFTRFAAGGMVIVMIVAEMIRAWQLWPLGSHIENVCRSLRGKWDNKYLTLSQVYLLVGAFLPLWLLPTYSNPTKLALSSGLISIGVGDTAAAVVGTFLGKNKLGKSEKTLEGLLGNIGSMILFKLVWIGFVGFEEELSFLLASCCVAVVEASTDNCDNLILPLVFMLMIDLFG